MNAGNVTEKIINCWKENIEDDGFDYLMPVIPEVKEQQNSLLFIGLNPSFNIRGWVTLLNKAWEDEVSKDVICKVREIFGIKVFDDESVQRIFSWKSNKEWYEIEYSTLSGVEELAKHNYKYFKPLTAFAEGVAIEGVNGEPAFLDLFQLRCTNQKDAKKILCKKGSLTKWGESQLDITRSLICKINPPAIVIANAWASSLFVMNSTIQKEFRLTGKPGLHNEVSPYYEIEINDKKIPVFPSSMIGNGVMDRYSIIRFQIYIKEILSKYLS